LPLRKVALAHIHLPDGALSLGWVVIWWFTYLLVLSSLLFKLRKTTFDPLRIAITAMATAVSFAVFQIDVPVLGGIHLNLTPLIGILLGPALGTLSVFIVNIFSSAVGHGGWGLIGANSIINSIEVLLSYHVFRVAKERLGLFSSAVTAALAGLVVGNFTMIGVVAISGIQGSTLTRTEIISNLVPLAGVNLFVAVIEGIVTGFTVTYMSRFRPDLLKSSPSESLRIVKESAKQS